MNSTDNASAPGTDAVTDFFEKRFIPVAEKLRERNITFFSLHPDKNKKSYYSVCSGVSAPISTLEEEEIVETLKARWESEQLPELAELAESFLELALQCKKEEHTEEISPFIYTMF